MSKAAEVEAKAALQRTFLLVHNAFVVLVGVLVLYMSISYGIQFAFLSTFAAILGFLFPYMKNVGKSPLQPTIAPFAKQNMEGGRVVS